MHLSSQLAKRFREVILDGRWVANTNFQLLLADISWQQATQKVGTHNSIASLTFHINYYIAGVLQVFEGGDLVIRDKYSFDMEPVTSEAQWQNMKSALFRNAEAFAAHVEKFSDEQLQAVFVKEAYGNYYRSIEGMIEHCYYHLGQVSLLKKLISKP